MSPYLFALLRSYPTPVNGFAPAGWTTADLDRSIKADERYPTHNLPERRALEAKLYWESVRADDAAEYRAECAAAAAYTF